MPLNKRKPADDRWLDKPTSAGNSSIIDASSNGANILLAVFESQDDPFSPHLLPILVSQDFGETWQRTQGMVPQAADQGAVPYESRLNCVNWANGRWMAAGNRVFSSSNPLVAWEEVTNFVGFKLDIKHANGAYIAATDFAIYRSENLTSWEQVHFHLGSYLSRARLAYDYFRNVWVMGGVQTGGGGLEAWHYSSDGGITWGANIAHPSFESAVYDVIYTPENQFVAVGGIDNSVLGITRLGDGSDWQIITTPFANSGGLRAVGFDNYAGEWLVASASGKFFISKDLINWQQCDTSGVANPGGVQAIIGVPNQFT